MDRVTPFNPARKGSETGCCDGNDRWLRRQAVQLAALLPDNEEDSLQIVRHLEALICTFLAGSGEPKPVSPPLDFPASQARPPRRGAGPRAPQNKYNPG